MKFNLLIIFLVSFITVQAQLTVNNDPPNDSPAFLVDTVLLGNGVAASNHQYQGDSIQIGFFDGVASNLGINSGIVMSTGDISILDPTFLGFGDNVNVDPIVLDPDLLDVANSVPALIGQNFIVQDINDVAVLEFDFIPSSDTVSFQYVFASQEYFGYENTQYNDVFGFFISGPGIAGPYASPAGFPDGSINIATIEDDAGTLLPVTISSVNATVNPDYFVNNQGLETVDDADGFTIPLTAVAAVQCGETYHIRLAIADGSDNILSSYVFLEENSFSSPYLEVFNDLGQDSSHIQIPCGTEVTLSAQMSVPGVYDYLWSNGLSGQSISVGEGLYTVQVTSSINCVTLSDTFYVDELNTVEIDLGDDVSICEGESTVLSPQTLNALAPISFNWSSGQDTEEITVSEGTHTLTITDANGCIGQDEITVISVDRPTAFLDGGGAICEGQSFVLPLDVDLTGQPPFLINYTNGSQQFIDTAMFSNHTINAMYSGNYSITSLSDNNCSGSASGSAVITTNTLPKSIITGGESMCDGDSTQIRIDVEVDAFPYNVLLSNGNYSVNFSSLLDTYMTTYVSEPAVYAVDRIIDANGCQSIENTGSAIVTFKEFVNPDISSQIDSVVCPVDSAFQLTTLEPNGLWTGKGMGLNNFFYPINASMGTNWIYYSFPENCNETDSLAIEIGCDLQIFIPNSFTPNGDSENEFLSVKGINILSFEMSIYNRWGEMMFYTNDINDFWDGKFKNQIVPEGAYSYSYNAYGKDAQFINRMGLVNVLH
jgi:gliding motility-associated-like protein